MFHLVLEVALAGKDHDHVALVGSSDDFVVANGAAGLDGGDGTGFSIELDPDQTIDWQVDPNNKFWGSNETITFFFQSKLAPGLGAYNMVNGEVGTAISYAPVPEPSTYLLFGSALALVALRRRKKSA